MVACVGTLFWTGVGAGVVFVFGHHVEEAFQFAVVIASIGTCVIGTDVLDVKVGTVVHAELVVLACRGKVAIIHHSKITGGGGIIICAGVAAQFLHLIHRIVNEEGAAVDDAQHIDDFVHGIFLGAQQGVDAA